MSDLVSVIIPAHNANETIEETIRSAQSQTHANLEIIVVDDGSIDGTAERVSRLQQGDGRIVLREQANAGVAAARNAGLSMAKGPLVAPLDADDIWHPEKLARQLARLTSDDIGLVYCWTVDIDERSTALSCDASRYEGDVYAALVLSNFIGNSSTPLMRRTLLEEIGGWDSTLRAANAQGCEDWLLYLKIAARSRVALAPGFLVGYRQSANSMSRDITKMRRSYELVMQYARRSQKVLPAELFARSEFDFDRYAFRLSRSSGAPLQVLANGLRLVTHHPASLAYLARTAFRQASPTASGILRTPQSTASARRPSTFHGLRFGDFPPDAMCEICLRPIDEELAAFIDSMPPVLADPAADRR